MRKFVIFFGLANRILVFLACPIQREMDATNMHNF